MCSVVSLSLLILNKSKHVRVIIRTRPTSEFAQDIIRFGDDHKARNEGGYINNQQENWDFKFDNILHNASQETVYEDCGTSIVKGLLEGYNGTILAYGQTGAGKTFTMQHRGLIPRTISHIYREIADRPQFAFTVRVSYLEIYNENMGDLLSTLSTNSNEGILTVVEEKGGRWSIRAGASYVKGLTMPITNNEEEALNYLFEGETNRAIAEHQMNKGSTRSHCIFTIYIESRSRVESSEKVMYSKLNLVDLAGSERLSKTQTSGVSLKEAMHINKSLTFLEQVIIALADKKRDHVPYRQSKLTNVLRDALGGNCNTLMIANIWGEKEHIEETISTLRFATRMMCVTNTPELNVQYDPLALIKKYENQIRELKQELAMHDTLASRSHVQYEPFTETQRFELQKTLKSFIEKDDEDIEIINLRQIREILNQFKIMYKNLEAELEDVNRHPRNTISTFTSIQDRAPAADSELQSRSNDLDKDDGVGDMEGNGFNVGLAPMGGRGGAPSKTSNKDKKGAGGKRLSKLVPNAVHHEPGDDESLKDGYNKNRLLPPPSRADEFESFKKGKGMEMNRILNENKAVLKDKKKGARDMAEIVNNLKHQIDEVKESIGRKKVERTRGYPNDKLGDNVIIDEEEYTLLNTLKQLKAQYREQFDQLKHTRSDIEYCTRLVDQCRQKLMSEFEQWYEATYGAQLADVDGDVMDIGEKFERLQMERMSQEDPDSLPYYNAKRRTLKVSATETPSQSSASNSP
ncbi:P-loop containing nucleoside triphosphate hydrolase protein [Polychytrium aggregatum]|uniref:P-loop containing nucleoside triphosphate hydrolase protein n=1 Tax=Polychytrium aggregatum TaxID=110093 RepID=UPI0022FE60FE|nr:P-loop containing nucleoside triphosphate hydrolase protein [Polychytrium aggregatum]KAI9203521.1 P-loop containing nucleoside triphosphate hydrolase protein [Polychytrium aggregatum]